MLSKNQRAALEALADVMREHDITINANVFSHSSELYIEVFSRHRMLIQAQSGINHNTITEILEQEKE